MHPGGVAAGLACQQRLGRQPAAADGMEQAIAEEGIDQAGRKIPSLYPLLKALKLTFLEKRGRALF